MVNSETAFGYLLPTREVIMAPGAPDFASMINLAERAEGFGFDSVWCGDSVLARPRLEAISTLAAIADGLNGSSWAQRFFSLLCAIQLSWPTKWLIWTSCPKAESSSVLESPAKHRRWRKNSMRAGCLSGTG